MTLKIFTCLICKQEYNIKDRHNCLDRIKNRDDEHMGRMRSRKKEMQSQRPLQ